MRLMLTALIFLNATAANAESLYQLLSKGYEVVWSGYAAVQTCVHGQDVHLLGPYAFVCDRFSYEYPYHYGDVHLVGRRLAFQGRTHTVFYMCLGEDGDCIEGSVLSRY